MKKPSSKELLRAARNLIINIGWGKGCLAKDKYYREVSPEHPEVKYFCAVGALQKARLDTKASLNTYHNASLKLERALNRNINFHFGMAIHEYNDSLSTTKEDIINLYNKAIKG